jgi:hypothetical protein
MNKWAIVSLIGMLATQATQCYGDATIKLSNLESKLPLDFANAKAVAAGDDFYVQVLAGPVGGPFIPVAIIGTPTLPAWHRSLSHESTRIQHELMQRGPLWASQDSWLAVVWSKRTGNLASGFRQVLDCGSPLPLSLQTRNRQLDAGPQYCMIPSCQSGRGLPQSKTLSRGSDCRTELGRSLAGSFCFRRTRLDSSYVSGYPERKARWTGQ